MLSMELGIVRIVSHTFFCVTYHLNIVLSTFLGAFKNDDTKAAFVLCVARFLRFLESVTYLLNIAFSAFEAFWGRSKITTQRRQIKFFLNPKAREFKECHLHPNNPSTQHHLRKTPLHSFPYDHEIMHKTRIFMFTILCVVLTVNIFSSSLKSSTLIKQTFLVTIYLSI